MTNVDVKKKSLKWVIAFVVITTVCAIGSYLRNNYKRTLLVDGLKPVATNEALDEIVYNVEPIEVNVNTATVKELCTLPGVTPKIARNIIEFREALGGIKNITDLRFVPGIGDTIFEEICVYVTIE